MIWLRQAVLFPHILAATFWVGEMLFVALVAGPVGRGLPPRERAALILEAGRRTLPWIWTAIAVLIATGIGNLYFLRIGRRALLSAPLHGTALGWMLAGKLLAAMGMFTHAAVHDFVHGHRLRRIEAEWDRASEHRRRELEAERARARRAMAAMRRANLVLALVVLALAAGLGART